MIPTWPMVFAALIAGVIGGFMIPDRPQSRSAAVEASTSEKQSETKARTAEKASDSKSTQLARSENLKTDGGPCALDAWPYRKPGCLDRTAAVTPANTVVNVRPADPDTVVWQEGEKKPGPEPVKPAAEPAPPPAKAVETAEPSPAAAETPKESVAESAAARPATRPAPAAPQAAPGVQPAAAFGAEPAARQADENRPRRPARRTTRVPDFNDGIPTRVYLRGPDGRLYLAPDYRPPSGRTVYYVR